MINRIVNIIKKTFKHQTSAETDWKWRKKLTTGKIRCSVERWEEGMIETEDQSRESINNKRDSAMKKAI